jgi:hypothetical protein
MYLAGLDPQVGSGFSTLAEPEPEVQTQTLGVCYAMFGLAPPLLISKTQFSL